MGRNNRQHTRRVGATLAVAAMACILAIGFVASQPAAGQNAKAPGGAVGFLAGLAKLDRKLTGLIDLAKKGKINSVDVVNEVEIPLDKLEREFLSEPILGQPFYKLQGRIEAIDEWLQAAGDEVGTFSIGNSVRYLDDALANAQALKSELTGKSLPALDKELQGLEDDLASVTEKARNGELKRGALKDAIKEVARSKYAMRAVYLSHWDIFGLNFAAFSNYLDEVHNGLRAARDALNKDEQERAVQALESAKKSKQTLETKLHQLNETQLYQFSFGPLGLTFDDTVPVSGGQPVVEHWSVQIQGGTACGTNPASAVFEVPWTLTVNGGTPQKRTVQETFATNPFRFYNFTDTTTNSALAMNLRLVTGPSPSVQVEETHSGSGISNVSVSPQQATVTETPVSPTC